MTPNIFNKALHFSHDVFFFSTRYTQNVNPDRCLTVQLLKPLNRFMTVFGLSMTVCHVIHSYGDLTDSIRPENNFQSANRRQELRATSLDVNIQMSFIIRKVFVSTLVKILELYSWYNWLTLVFTVLLTRVYIPVRVRLTFKDVIANPWYLQFPVSRTEEFSTGSPRLIQFRIS